MTMILSAYEAVKNDTFEKSFDLLRNTEMKWQRNKKKKEKFS